MGIGNLEDDGNLVWHVRGKNAHIVSEKVGDRMRFDVFDGKFHRAVPYMGAALQSDPNLKFATIKLVSDCILAERPDLVPAVLSAAEAYRNG